MGSQLLEGVVGWGGGGGGYAFIVKFSLKPNPIFFIPMYAFLENPFPKTEAKRNVQKFLDLTFTFLTGWMMLLYTSAFWLFSSTFSSSFLSSSEEPFSFSPVFQLPCLDFLA